jgi:Flp pilus assembly protein TadG
VLLTRHRRDRERGATTAEFATVLPLFLIIMFGATDGAFLLLSRFLVTHAAVVGARTASARSTTTVAAVRTAAINSVPFLALGNSAVTVRLNGNVNPQTDPPFAAAKAVGSTVTVSVSYTYRSFTGAFSRIGTVGLNASSVVTAE